MDNNTLEKKPDIFDKLMHPTGKDDAEFQRVISQIEENILRLLQQISEL